MNNTLTTLIETAEMNVTTPIISKTRSKYSFGIVNTAKNGKRLSISKQLCEDIDLKEEIFLLPSEASGEIFVSALPISDKCSQASLKGDSKKLCYCAPLVKLLIDTFNLDFGGHTSMSFADISVEDLKGVKVARIHMRQPVTEVKLQVENEAETTVQDNSVADEARKENEDDSKN